jgi:hypothetical protein
MAIKLKNVENETQTMYELEYGKKYWKTWKLWNDHYGTQDMARNLKKVKNEKQTLYNMEYGKKYWKTWKLKKSTLYDLDYCKKYWKTWKMINAQCRTCNMARKLKKKKMRNTHFRTWIRRVTVKNVKKEKYKL